MRTEIEIANALDDADLFLRDRANSSPTPLNEYDIAIMLDIAKVCDEAARMLERAIVPPCKVGDVVYFIRSKQIFEGRVILIRPFIHKDHTNFHGNVLYECIDPFYSDGRTMEHQISVVFEEYGENTIAYLTREEAEQVLKGGAE